MFKKISYTIALQFTGFVFLLFLINGALFLAADFRNARRQTEFQLVRSAELAQERLVRTEGGGVAISLPPMLRERVRIVGMEGDMLYAGELFEQIPFNNVIGLEDVMIESERYRVLTMPLMMKGTPAGFIQIADAERGLVRDFPFRVLLYLIVSGGISALTFFAGLFFARHSLKPAERMVRQLEQFTQDASHELRTPIAALSSSLDLALKNGKYQEGIVSAKQDVQQVADLVSRLLELARLDSFTILHAPVSLSSLTWEAVERFTPLAAEKKVKIEHSIVPNIQVTGDEALLRQVISNLLSNAIKFSKSAGGTVRVDLTKSRLQISDQGTGISAAHLPHIFDRFYRADDSRSTEGLGLGLAFVKRVAEAHGWTVTVDSKEGEGSVFTVSIAS